MGLLDLFLGQDDPASANSAGDTSSSFAGLSPQASDNVRGALSAIGQGMLAGNRYQWVNPQVFAAAIKEQGNEADRAQQRRALKLILKQANPNLSDAELEVMANDPATAKLAMTQAEAQSGVKAGQQAAGLLGGLFGGAASPSSSGDSSSGGATPAANGSSGGAQIPGSLSLRPIDEDTAIRTVLAESGNQGPEGMKAVAGVLRNRALLAGTDVSTEALKPNQFEPWNPDSGNDPRRFKPDSPEYKAARDAVLPVLRGEAPDPTGGATHFYAPRAQAALGRDAPSWDDGTGTDLGGHRFFRRPYAGKDPAVLARQGSPNIQVADASGTGGLPIVDSNQPGFSQGGLDPLAGFVPSGGGYSGSPEARAAAASIPPIGTNRSPAPPAPKPLPGSRDAGGNVQVAENEQQAQALEGRMGMLPRSVYGIVPQTQSPTATAQANPADLPAPGAANAEFFIPPGAESAPAPSRYGPTTQRALEAQANRQQGGGLPTAAQAMAPNFPLNDPKQAAAAIPKLMQVLSIPNLPDSYKAQAKTALDYALGVVKPTDRTRQLMEAGYTPGTDEYRQAYKNLVNSDRTPSGYRFTGDGQGLEAIPGGPADPANKGSKAPPTGYRAVDDGNRFEPIPGGPADTATIAAQAAAKASARPAAPPKPLPQNAVKALSDAGESFGDLTRIAGSFQPAYGGWKVGKLGEAANQIARTTGIGNTEAADWWSDYAQKRNVVRNKLFGSALTAQEKAEFEKADITPGMTPDAIQKVLARQQAAALGAARKLAAYHVKTGRDPAEIEAAMGVGLDELGVTAGGGSGNAPAAPAASAPRPSSGAQPARPAFSPSDIEAEARRRGLIQ